jgi:hypothetical protein
MARQIAEPPAVMQASALARQQSAVSFQLSVIGQAIKPL